MTDEHDSTRRMLISALAGLTLAHVAQPSAADVRNNPKSSRILVAYFSRSGNTRVIAGVIHRSLKTDLFEIEPANAYPEDYFQTVAQAKDERDRRIRPLLKNGVASIERYQTIYLGFPIWGTTIPPVVQTFLSTHNLRSQRLVPFITHGGYGLGNSEDVLAALTPGNTWERPLTLECDQERKTTEAVTSWLDTVQTR
ncbi:flavodoxin [Pectobacterium jejuense]|uniref:Flavodoxin n=1 Tax=Pectobacterium jejuense TaxID=2974022 RepID=A0ABW8GPJ8_9GAMM